jgi:hypothetical protein
VTHDRLNKLLTILANAGKTAGRRAPMKLPFYNKRFLLV